MKGHGLALPFGASRFSKNFQILKDLDQDKGVVTPHKIKSEAIKRLKGHLLKVTSNNIV